MRPGIRAWLKTTAFERIHGTHRQKICERFERERPYLGDLPAYAYDLSLKYVRKVHKDCQLSFEGNRYVVPHQLAGKKVLLRVKDRMIRIFDNDTLITNYRRPEDTGNTLAHPRFYRELKQDQQQVRRKYRKPFGKPKATRGIVKADLNVDVARRSLAVYEEAAL